MTALRNKLKVHLWFLMEEFEMRLHLSLLKFSDGTEIELEPGDTVFIVGPNNSGKSATLKEIDQYIQNHQGQRYVLQHVKYEVAGTQDDLLERIKENYRSTQNRGGPILFSLGTARLQESGIIQQAAAIHNQGTQSLKNVFVQLLSTENRLTAANAVERVDYDLQGPNHAIHELEIDDRLEEKVNRLFEKAFSTSITVHRSAGKHLPLVVGQRPELGAGEDRLSHTYLKQIACLPRLETQGDGMRSFVSIVLNTQIVDKDINLVDEPEAFLHPVQIRMLGGILCKRSSPSSQALISTHSGELVRAAITQPESKVKIIRLERQGDVNRPSLLNNDELNKLWEDPLLKHSNILDGLFHQGVVICESDSDCRFFSALLEELSKSQATYPDVMFAHCGGKDRMDVAVNALRGLNVPVKSICDIDLVRDKSTAKKLYEAHGGDWTLIESHWNILQAAVRDLQAEISTAAARDEISRILDSITGSTVSKREVQEIQTVLRRASPWKRIKSDGEQAIPSGEPFTAFTEILQQFESVGLYVLRVGELEGFVRSVGGHGPKWVNTVYERYSLHDEVLSPARSFIERVCRDFFK